MTKTLLSISSVGSDSNSRGQRRLATREDLCLSNGKQTVKSGLHFWKYSSAGTRGVIKNPGQSLTLSTTTIGTQT